MDKVGIFAVIAFSSVSAVASNLASHAAYTCDNVRVSEAFGYERSDKAKINDLKQICRDRNISCKIWRLDAEENLSSVVAMVGDCSE